MIFSSFTVVFPYNNVEATESTANIYSDKASYITGETITYGIENTLTSYISVGCLTIQHFADGEWENVTPSVCTFLLLSPNDKWEITWDIPEQIEPGEYRTKGDYGIGGVDCSDYAYFNVTSLSVDMLIITNYNNLFKNYGSSAISLLDKISEIAITQKGKILYTDGYNTPLEIHQLIKQKAREMEELEYLMIVGGEEIIPFWQINDPTGHEKYILSDYCYGDLNDDNWVDLSVGRIIGDELEDIISLLMVSENSENNDNVIVSGDDFCTDDVKRVEELLTDSGFSVKGIYGLWNILLPLNIQDKLLIFHEGHADWYIWGGSILGLIPIPYLFALEIRLAGLGYTSPIVHTIGCHAGLVRRWMGDWSSIPLAFVDEGVVAYIGGTCYQYGAKNGEGLSETIARYFVENLLEGKSVGMALRNSKLKYLKDKNNIFDLDWKVVLQHSLYGNPKYKPNLPFPFIIDPVITNYSFSNVTLFCSSAEAEIHSYDTNINISSYNITYLENGYNLIVIPGEGFINEEGKYILPALSREILLPYGAELYSINLTSYNKTKLSGINNLPICQMEIIGDGDDGSSSPQSNNNIINFTYSVAAIENPNGTKTIVIQISPVEYHPDNGTVYIYTDFNFSIKYLMSNTYMSNIISDKLQYEPGENVTISTNIINSGAYSPIDINLSTILIGENITAKNTTTISTILLSSMGDPNVEIWNGSIPEGGYYRISAVLKDSSNNTLDTKFRMIRVTKEPEITFSTIFLEQNHNVTPRIDIDKPFNLTTAVDNIGDYNATNVTATIHLPFNIYTTDNITKEINAGTIPRFESHIVKWNLKLNESGNHSILTTINSSNAGNDSNLFTLQTTNPSVDFTWTPQNPKVSELIQFIDNSVDIDGIIMNWTWNFSKGVISYEQNPIHSYSNYGIYDVTLTVKDDYGAIATLTKQINIKDNTNGNGGTGNYNPPSNSKPSADANGPYFEFEDVALTFDGSGSSDSDGDIVSYDWDFGDGKKGTGVSLSYAYEDAGNYTVILTVADNGGRTDTDTTYALITSKPNIPPDKPLISGNTTGSKNVDYSFVAQTIDLDRDNISYVFNWSDKSNLTITDYVPNGTSSEAFHNWSNAGIYPVVVYAIDENNATSESASLIMLIDPVSVSDLGYFFDSDDNGEYDLFFSNETETETCCELQRDGIYCIDTDGDEAWDYRYDSISRSILSYSEQESLDEKSKEQSIVWIIVIAVIVVILILTVVALTYIGKK